jgi:hypothetical protein
MKSPANLPQPLEFGKKEFLALKEILDHQYLRSQLRIIRESLGGFIGRNLNILAVEKLNDESELSSDTFILFSIAGDENKGEFMSSRKNSSRMQKSFCSLCAQTHHGLKQKKKLYKLQLQKNTGLMFSFNKRHMSSFFFPKISLDSKYPMRYT